MILYEHICDSDGIRVKEFEVRETAKQYRISSENKGYFANHTTTMNKADIDIPFTRYSVYCMYSLGTNNDKLIEYSDCKLRQDIESAKKVLASREAYYSQFKERCNK